MIQDETPNLADGGRLIATDLLDTAPGAMCSDTMPCPANDPPCAIPDGMDMGTCPRPLNPANTPPAIGKPIALGGNMIRMVFDELLDPRLDERSDLVVLNGPDGGAIDCVAYSDPSGAPLLQPAFFGLGPVLFPYGPALVLKPKAPLFVNTSYTLAVDVADIHDKKGRALTEDSHGAIMASYGFTTEGLYVLQSTPDLSMSPVIATNDALRIAVNADLDEATATQGAVIVTGASGVHIAVRAFSERDDATACMTTMSRRTLVIIPAATSTSGRPVRASVWPEGSYTLSLSGLLDRDTHRTALKADVSATGDFSAAFSVMGPNADPTIDPSAMENVVLPESCTDHG
jgi:hypothetical protein